MLGRKREGAVVCRSCGRLVGVNDAECFNCGARNPALWGWAPVLQRLGGDFGFVHIVTWGCIALYVLMLVYDPAGVHMGGMSLVSPSTKSAVIFGASGSIPVFGFGRWWTLLSAAWLHGGVLHILFNLMWVRQLTPVTSSVFGPSRMVLIYTIASVTGFLLSTFAGTQVTLGASAPLFGLFGALVWAGRRTGSSELGRQALIYAAVLMVFGFLFPGVDNFAHIGGFIGGFLAAVGLDPLRRESFGHMIAALACIVLTAASLLASVLTV